MSQTRCTPGNPLRSELGHSGAGITCPHPQFSHLIVVSLITLSQRLLPFQLQFEGIPRSGHGVYKLMKIATKAYCPAQRFYTVVFHFRTAATPPVPRRRMSYNGSSVPEFRSSVRYRVSAPETTGAIKLHQ